MQLIRGQLRLTTRLSKSVVTIGNFDGFHLGHQQLLNTVLDRAQAIQAPTVVITFEPHPQEFLNSDRVQPRLMRFKEKWCFLSKQKIDYLVCLRFNTLLAKYSAPDFVSDILVKQLGLKAIVVGDDFHFGANREGNTDLLRQLGKQYHFEVLQIPSLTVDGERVSSTRIRQTLQQGHLSSAKDLLGQPYFLCGKVIHGEGRGNKWGLPTANIHLMGKPVVVTGVYVVLVFGLDQNPIPAVASVGKRPMFASQIDLLEVHLLDFNRDIYGCFLEVEFLHKLRDQQFFKTTDELISQIHQDIRETRDFFSDSAILDEFLTD